MTKKQLAPWDSCNDGSLAYISPVNRLVRKGEAEDPFHKVDKKFKGMKGKKVADGFLTRAPEMTKKQLAPWDSCNDGSLAYISPVNRLGGLHRWCGPGDGEVESS
jgi:hypothetical protein